MSFPGFSMGPMSAFRVNDRPAGSDFDIFEYFGRPVSVAPPGRLYITLASGFIAEGVTAGDFSVETPNSISWTGAVRTGAWPAGTKLYLIVEPGAEIRAKAGNGGNGGQDTPLNGTTFGGGGGGMGTPFGTGGTATPIATAGAAGTALTGGAGGVQGATGSTGGFVPGVTGGDASHALIVDDGVDLFLNNQGIIYGAGGGGNGGASPTDLFFLDGGKGLHADQDRSYDIRGGLPADKSGFTGAAVTVGVGATLTFVGTPAFPNYFGFEYTDRRIFVGVVDGP